LSQLADCNVDQISIEAAQPHLDLGVFSDLSNKAIVLGIVDLSTNEVESIDTLADRIRRALPFIEPDRLIPAPDCGMKYLSREAAFGKLTAMVAAAEKVRLEIA
jgi:5-methyltetrahydropteroyltriglutamate--homocysteine methyltransferase